ncbi:MAG: histidine phosphotransferase family protein [Planktotalea sp.]|uniref:histidine phosphotransferase family protein n=1 Tax=Planktotalea sp. TaxID=2029877 RepID=UPI003C78A465
MGQHSLHFAALVGSRICHDLISPIGAINNGMELISMTGSAVGPEMALISESVDAANARIRFFRIAYGAPSETQLLGRAEITSILRDITRGSRLLVQWDPVEDLSRSEVQIAFLAIQCAEQAMAFGGTLTITRRGKNWHFDMAADRLRLEPALWDTLSRAPGETDNDSAIVPAHVQFLLLPLCASNQGRNISFVQTAEGASLTI